MPFNFDKHIGANRKCQGVGCENVLDKYQGHFCSRSCSNRNAVGVRWSDPEQIRSQADKWTLNNPMHNLSEEAFKIWKEKQAWTEERKEYYSNMRRKHPEFHEDRLKAAHSPEIRKKATDTILKNNPDHFSGMAARNNGGGFRSKIRARYKLDGFTPAEFHLYNYPGFQELDFEPFKTIYLNNRWIYPDFLHSLKRVVLEIDGTWHNQNHIRESDKLKEMGLMELGYRVFRFSNKRVFGFSDQIVQELKELE